MAYIGLRNAQWAPISTPRVDGSAIAYGTPIVLGPSVGANLTMDIADNPDYGDDIVQNNDKGVNGYNIAMELNDITKEGRAACLGWHANTGTGTSVVDYQVNDDAPPEGGLAYIRVKLPPKSSTRKYEAFFYHCVQCTSGGENASTKKKQIEWNHPTINAAGVGVYIDNSGKARFFDWMEFESESAAQTWINGKFGYTPPTP